MSFRASLFIENRTLNILYCEYSFFKQTNKDNYPVTRPQAGYIVLHIESSRDGIFEDWMLSPLEKKSGSIVFYKRDNMSKMREILFADAYCVSFQERYSSTGEDVFYSEIKLTAGELRFGDIVYQNPWFDTTSRRLGNQINSAPSRAENISEVSKKVEQQEKKIEKISPTPIIEDNKIYDGEVMQEVVIEADKPGFLKKFIVKAANIAHDVYATPVNFAINIVASAIVLHIPKKLMNYASTFTGNQSLVDASWDGKLLSCANCNGGGTCSIDPKSKCPAPTTLSMPGKKPTNRLGETCSSNSLKKVYYMNGIQTDPKTSCQTSKMIAKSTCVEVMSMYNRTEGLGDISECIRSIRKGDKVPPSKEMVKLMKNHFGNPPKEPYEELNLYAHSQGGLITQQSLDAYKTILLRTKTPAETEKLMGNIKVKSFGTAKSGWTKGPQYEQYTNFHDPVPHVIDMAQLNYTEETFNEDTKGANITSHTIVKPNFNPIASHSMDEVYLDKLKETQKGKSIQGKCNSCTH